jgi:hypothetical protein
MNRIYIPTGTKRYGFVYHNGQRGDLCSWTRVPNGWTNGHETVSAYDFGELEDGLGLVPTTYAEALREYDRACAEVNRLALAMRRGDGNGQRYRIACTWAARAEIQLDRFKPAGEAAAE